MKKIILDCDPGHDDAIAMMLAIGNPQEIEIACISTVGGNQVLELTTQNALDLLHLMGAEIPVVAGLGGPLIRKLETAESVHGKSGLDGPTLARSPRRAEKRNFIDVYTEILTHSKEKITIVATGPQTNVATFLLARPELKHKIESIVFMGGACFGGNWSPKAEFNIFVDPEAAQIVSGCGIPLVMCGLDVTHKATITEEEVGRIAGIGNRTANVFQKLIAFYSRSSEPNFLHEYEGPKIRLHDVTAISYLLQPNLFCTRDLFVVIDTSPSPYSRGATVVDYAGRYRRPPNMKVCFDIERKAFVESLYTAISRLP